MKEFANQIQNFLNRDCRVTAVPVIDSTNRALKEQAAAGAPEGTVLLADRQTAGRGRMGRSFFSPAGCGLYFSIILRPQRPDPLKITMAAGVAVAEAVKVVFDIDLKIKWVNDLYLLDRKVCGILAEGAAGEKGLEWCVLGIGINVYAPREGFGELEQIAGALLPQGEADRRAELAAEILNHFFECYEKLDDPAVLEAYRERSYLQGRKVTAYRGNEVFEGKVIGIGDEAELLLQKDDGEIVALSSGEVRLENYR